MPDAVPVADEAEPGRCRHPARLGEAPERLRDVGVAGAERGFEPGRRAARVVQPSHEPGDAGAAFFGSDVVGLDAMEDGGERMGSLVPPSGAAVVPHAHA
ncbi:MAG TPA: hypothetical protein VNX21_06100, partial [Candidatus Thermoplasmatota archaeon]|nr:hypothetical protein [Candidatus Thermoplasmatota archaeon]